MSKKFVFRSIREKFETRTSGSCQGRFGLKNQFFGGFRINYGTEVVQMISLMMSCRFIKLKIALIPIESNFEWLNINVQVQDDHLGV